MGIWKPSIKIQNFNDIERYHTEIHSGDLPYIRDKNIFEWQCLLNVLKKLKWQPIAPELMRYPFTIEKSERPDFLLHYADKIIGAEITKVTTKRLETLRSMTEKTDENAGYVESLELLNDRKPEKGELNHLIVKPGDENRVSTTIGFPYEKKWAELCLKEIKKKLSKSYSNRVAYLILNDIDFPHSNLDYKFEHLSHLIPSQDWGDKTIFPNILTNTAMAIGAIRLSGIWECKAYKMPLDWRT